MKDIKIILFLFALLGYSQVATEVEIEYVGCFNNHTPRISGHLSNHLTIEECSGHTNEYFGMEYPQASQTPGEAQCVPITSWPANERRPDSECAAELDSQGRYLGGGHRIAIYRIVKDGLRNQDWNYENEYVSSWNTEFFSNDRAKQLYQSGEFKSHSIDCDIQFRVQRDNTQSRTSFSFMTLNDGKIFNVNMQGKRTNHQNWSMEDDCRTLKCYDYEQSSPRGNSGYCPSEFYDGTTPKTLEVLLLRVNFRPEDMNGNSQPWRNKYTFKGTTYALHGPTEMPSSNPTKTPSVDPSKAPTPSPTDAPSASPSTEPTPSPTDAPSSQPTITYPYPRSGTLGVATTNEWNFENEDSTSYSVSIFSAEEQALLKSGSFQVHCDLSFRLQRDDSASSSSFTYLDLDTNTVHTQQMQGGYQDHQRFEMPSCSEITCHKSQWSSCPWTSKNAILLAVDFRPRSGHAHGSDWTRNRFTFKGTHYYVTQVSYDYVEVQNHHGCHQGGNLGNIGRPTAQGIQKDARCEFVKLLNAFGNGCSHDLDVACPEGSNYDPQTVLCSGACDVACESICKESCDDSDVCVGFAIHGRYGPQMYDQRGVSCSDNQHGLTPSGGWTAFVKQGYCVVTADFSQQNVEGYQYENLEGIPVEDDYIFRWQDNDLYKMVKTDDQGNIITNGWTPSSSTTWMDVSTWTIIAGFYTVENFYNGCHVPTQSPTQMPSIDPSKAPTPSPTDAPSALPTPSPTDAPSASSMNSNPILREGDVCYRLVKEQSMCQKGWQDTGGCNGNCDSLSKCAVHVNWGTPGFLVDRGNYNGRFCAQCQSTTQIAGGNGNYDLYEYVDCPLGTFSIKFGGQAWGMAKSMDGGVTWTPIATVDMHTYQHPYPNMIGEVRDVAQDGMIIKFQPIHAQLANDLGYLCPRLHEKCDGTCTYDPQRDLNGCFNWDGARIYIHEMTINGQVQDFSSLDAVRASGWDFQCRVNQWCNNQPVTIVPGSVTSNMLRFDGSDFYWTYTFSGKGGRRSLASPQGNMDAPSGLRRLLAKLN